MRFRERGANRPLFLYLSSHRGSRRSRRHGPLRAPIVGRKGRETQFDIYEEEARVFAYSSPASPKAKTGSMPMRGTTAASRLTTASPASRTQRRGTAARFHQAVGERKASRSGKGTDGVRGLRAAHRPRVSLGVPLWTGRRAEKNPSLLAFFVYHTMRGAGAARFAAGRSPGGNSHSARTISKRGTGPAQCEGGPRRPLTPLHELHVYTGVSAAGITQGTVRTSRERCRINASWNVDDDGTSRGWRSTRTLWYQLLQPPTLESKKSDRPNIASHRSARW